MPLACPATEHSKFRYRRLTELVEHISGAGAINSFSLLKNILSDHQNRPLSICRHENEQPDHNATIFSVIIDLNQRKLGVAVGNPCDNMFTEVPL
jgi:isopenicillin-N N-acyltransferase-like protein